MKKCGIEVNKLTIFFCNQLMDAMLNSMLKYRNRKLIPVSTRPQNFELEKSEIETLRYIAGFIVFLPEKRVGKNATLLLHKYQFYLNVGAQSETMTLVLPWKNTQMLG